LQQALQLLIFAALAAVVLYQLYAVLGRRVGRQPPDNSPATTPAAGRPATAAEAADGVTLGGLAALKARDAGFDLNHFLAGARTAYETIVRAFAAGDRAALAGLLAAPVSEAFEAAMAERESEGRSGTAEFLHPPRADVDMAEVDGETARIRVRFLAEFRSRSKGPEGEAVDDRRTAELWTFERNLASKDPNWILARVDAAEA
jgi:predicted lipid-binding transport protein (Tim44 family)